VAGTRRHGNRSFASGREIKLFCALVLTMLSSYYFLYKKFNALSVCQAQSARLDAIEAELGRMGR
jgi:hypothetical protein